MYSKGEKAQSNYIVYFKAILRGLALSLILLFVAAILFYFTSLKDEYMDLVAWIITVIAICYAGIYATFRIGNKGFFHGILVGITFILLLMLIAFIIQRGEFRLLTYGIMLGVGVLIGGLSGIIGTLMSKGN